MDTWLLILLIILGTIILLILIILIASKFMKDDYSDPSNDNVMQKRSVYASKELNRVAQVEYSNSTYAQFNQNNSNNFASRNGLAVKSVDQDGFGDGEIVRVDLKEKRIWKENSFKKKDNSKNRQKGDGLKTNWDKTEIQIGNQVQLGGNTMNNDEGAGEVADRLVNPLQAQEINLKKHAVVQKKVQQHEGKKQIQIGQQARLGAFSKMKDPSFVAVKSPPPVVPNQRIEVFKPQEGALGGNFVPQMGKGLSPKENQFQSNNSQSQNLSSQQQFLRGNVPTLQSKISEKEYMFQTNKSMNNKVAEWQQKAVNPPKNS